MLIARWIELLVGLVWVPANFRMRKGSREAPFCFRLFSGDVAQTYFRAACTAAIPAGQGKCLTVQVP